MQERIASVDDVVEFAEDLNERLMKNAEGFTGEKREILENISFRMEGTIRYCNCGVYRSFEIERKIKNFL